MKTDQTADAHATLSLYWAHVRMYIMSYCGFYNYAYQELNVYVSLLSCSC